MSDPSKPRDLANTLRAEFAAHRADLLVQFDVLLALVDQTLAAHARGDVAATHELCKELLDTEYDLLGDTHSETLTEALGYDDE